MVHSSKLLPILFLCLSRRDSRLTLSQPLDSRLTVWHHSNVEILFCCVPTSPAIGATEMRTVVFDCFSDVSEFRTAQTECINISTYEHTSQQLRMAGSKKCHFSETHFRVLKRWKFSSTKCQVPATVAQDCCAGSIWVKISAINTSYHISYIIFIYIYIHQFSRFSLDGFLELSKWSECAWFRRHSETSLPEPSSSATVVTELPALPSPIFLEEVSVS
jgi:hypothetical protein